jgi:hypothetical protein
MSRSTLGGQRICTNSFWIVRTTSARVCCLFRQSRTSFSFFYFTPNFRSRSKRCSGRFNFSLRFYNLKLNYLRDSYFSSPLGIEFLVQYFNRVFIYFIKKVESRCCKIISNFIKNSGSFCGKLYRERTGLSLR